MKNLKKRGLALAMSVALTAGMLSGCGAKDKEVMSTAIHVDTQTAEVGTLELKGNYIGTASPNDSVDVTPMVSGTVEKVNVKVGDTVKEGDVLCQFDDTSAQLSLDSAKSSVDSAESGKKSASEQKDIAAQQSQSSIDALEESLSAYEKSLTKAKKQLKELKSSKSKLETAMNQAKEAYTASKTSYKTAETLYINYKSFLNANPDCQTTAGLTAAMTVTALPDGEDGSTAESRTQKAQTASYLMKSLNDAGLTVEYLSDSGLNSLKENASDAETAYNTAASSYKEAASGITSLESSIETLETQIDTTKSSIKSAKKAKSMTSSASDDVYDAQISAAQVGVESAEYQKDLYTIKAPISGVVEAVNVTKDEMFASGVAPAFTISGKQTMIVTFYVTEEVKDFLKTGDAVEVENNGQTFRGSISSIGTAVDAQKGLFKVEAQIYVSEGKSISTGVSVSLSLVTAAVKDNILIPYDAVYYENNQAYVYCVEDGKAVRVDVTTGLYNEDTIAIESGLQEGDEVITSWASGLKNGAEIAQEDNADEETATKAPSADNEQE